MRSCFCSCRIYRRIYKLLVLLLLIQELRRRSLELTLVFAFCGVASFFRRSRCWFSCTSAGVSTSKSFVGAADVGLDQYPTMSRLALAGDDLRRGAWTAEEDEKLRAYVAAHGTGHWRSVGRKAGTNCISFLVACLRIRKLLLLPASSLRHCGVQLLLTLSCSVLAEKSIHAC